MYSVKYEIPGIPAELKSAIDSILVVAKSHDFREEAVRDIEISLSEACKRIACHGFDGWCDKVEISCDLSDEDISILIRDACGKHNLTKDGHQCSHCPEEGDLAYFVMDSLMNKAEIFCDEAGNKCIKMVKNR